MSEPEFPVENVPAVETDASGNPVVKDAAGNPAVEAPEVAEELEAA